MTVSKPVTASTVRAYFQGDAARLARLDETAQATVVKGARGRLSPAAVKAFNKGRPAHRQYVLGATKAANADRAATRAKAAALGAKVGKAGPLSADALAVLKG